MTSKINSSQTLKPASRPRFTTIRAKLLRGKRSDMKEMKKSRQVYDGIDKISSEDIFVNVGNLIVSYNQFQYFANQPSTDDKLIINTNEGMDSWYYLYSNNDDPEIQTFCVKRDAKSYYRFNWKFCYKNKWYRFESEHEHLLETNYADVTINTFYIVSTGSTLSMMIPGIVKWKINFQRMKVESETHSLPVKRTSYFNGSEIEVLHEWCFRDECDKWIKFGKSNSKNEVKFISSVDSCQIEEQFCKGAANSIEYHNSKFNYTLDFNKMEQINHSTNTVRQVTRRPKHCGVLYGYKTPVFNFDLPFHWDVFSSTTDNYAVKLDYFNSEYQTIKCLVSRTHSFINITEIKRIQNPYMYLSYENKKSYLKKKYKEHLKVKEKTLFYGNSSSIISKVVDEGFNWRGHNAVFNNKYGNGIYFSTRADLASSWCDFADDKIIIVAKVLIGEVTTGHPGMVRPPVNHETQQLFDTTVDDVKDPSVFVKFHQNECLPEYLVAFN